MSKIIGVGFHKTGTTTLGSCLKNLGYNHISCNREAFLIYHEKEIAALMKLMKHFDSFEDWPWPFIYREAYEKFPDSKFVLTTRSNEDTWFSSLERHVDRKAGGNFHYRDYIYGTDHHISDREYFIDRYLKHNDEVREFFADKPGQFIELCWEKGDGWKELCQFLGVPVPDAPFPHQNADPSKGLQSGSKKGMSRRLMLAARMILRGR